MLADERVLLSEKKKIMEAVMEKRIAADKAENESWYDYFFMRMQREGRELGVAEGRKEGRKEGRAQTILEFLDARGLPVSDTQRERILGCRDDATLARWARRAAVVATVDEIFGEP